MSVTVNTSSVSPMEMWERLGITLEGSECEFQERLRMLCMMINAESSDPAITIRLNYVREWMLECEQELWVTRRGECRYGFGKRFAFLIQWLVTGNTENFPPRNQSVNVLRRRLLNVKGVCGY